MIRLVVFVLLLLVGAGTSQAQKVYIVEEVPNTKVLNGNYLSDPDNMLRIGTKTKINDLLGGLEQQTTVQVAVVMLSSIGDAAHFDFAQKLFEKWGIGQAGKDNGLLILFVQDQKKIRFHTGFGLEGTLPDVICKRIEVQHMVPHFKEGHVDEGIVAGVEEVIKILTNPAYAEELRDSGGGSPANTSSTQPSTQTTNMLFNVVVWLVIGLLLYLWKKNKSGFTNSANLQTEQGPSLKVSSKQWLWRFVLFPVILIVGLSFFQDFWILWGGIYGYLLLTLADKRYRMAKETEAWLTKEDYHALYNFYDKDHLYWRLMAVLFLVPFAFLIIPYGRKKQSFRIHPRPCKSCGATTIRLGEDIEDAYLKKSQVFEEELKTADYDVWKCDACGGTRVYQYPSHTTKYSACPACTTIAFYTRSEATVQQATSSSQGMKEIKKTCKFCGHLAVTQVIIPIISSSSSSDSSGSSDSGGSYGGGDSGGGGASSSW